MGKFFINFMTLLSFAHIALGENKYNKVVCYYYSGNFEKEFSDIGQISIPELKKSLSLCTHLVYRYVDINPKTFKLFNVKGDSDENYRKITNLKSEYPHLKIYLSFGGDKDYNKDIKENIYIKFLESGGLHYQRIVNSSIKLLKENGFDGLDLEFQLPRNKPREVLSWWQKLLRWVSSWFGVRDEDSNPAGHNHNFTAFVSDLYDAYKNNNLELSLSVLPNVNASTYYNISALHSKFQHINLLAFDFLTPFRNPYEADYTSNIYFKGERYRVLYHSIDYQVQHWIDNGCPKRKLILGVPTYARTWKIETTDVGTSIPVISKVDGPGAPGLYSKREGLLNWHEVCTKLIDGNCTEFFERKYGNYALCPYDKKTSIYIAYDSPDFVARKARYVKRRGLGGLAIYDINYDDFRGRCNGIIFPILNSLTVTTKAKDKEEKNLIQQSYCPTNNRAPAGKYSYKVRVKIAGTESILDSGCTDSIYGDEIKNLLVLNN